MSDKSNYKWTSDKTRLFLEIYKQYTTLWDMSSEHYLKKDKRREALNDLAAELEEEGFGQIPVDHLRAKIKSIKDSYRFELNKIKKSMKSGAGPEDVHKPKLSWFDAADSFWRSVVTGGESIPEQEDAGESYSNSIQETHTSPNNRLRHNTTISPRNRSTYFKMRSSHRNPLPTRSLQRLGRRINTVRLETSVDKEESNTRTNLVDLDDEHEKYGKYIAAQLRSMPLRSVIILQNQINNLIAEERLNLIDSSSITLQQYPTVSLESLLNNAEQEEHQVTT